MLRASSLPTDYTSTPAGESKPDELPQACTLHIHEFYYCSSRSLSIEYELHNCGGGGGPAEGSLQGEMERGARWAHVRDRVGAPLISNHALGYAPRRAITDCQDVGKARPSENAEKVRGRSIWRSWVGIVCRIRTMTRRRIVKSVWEIPGLESSTIVNRTAGSYIIAQTSAT